MQSKLLNSKIHGSIHPNGNWKSQKLCNNSDYSGYQITWYENGNIKSAGNFENNQPIGLHKFWNKNKNLCNEIIYKDGNAFTLTSGVNKVILVGNVVENHTTRDSSFNVVTTSLLIATSEWWTNKNTGHKQEKTEWHRITISGKPTEEACYCYQGSKVYIEGRLEAQTNLNITKTNRCASEIIVGNPSGICKRLDPPFDHVEPDATYVDNMANFDLEPF